MDSVSRFLKFNNKLINDDSGNPLQGDVFKENVILRFKDGKLHGSNEPAVECLDNHHEYWVDGVLTREDGPAVISDYGDIREYWDNGKLINVEKD